MASDHNFLDFFLEEIEFENEREDDQFYSYDYNNELSKSESQLCVPPDPVEDLEWFPNFQDDLISLKNYDDYISSQPQNDYFVDDNSSQSRESFDQPATPHQQKETKSKHEDTGVKDDENDEYVLMDMNGRRKRKKFRTTVNRKPRKNMKFEIKRCTHCEVEETPQWRNGPMGPKTLCNACGVRYKSGRLLPEYRPKASPSFDSSKHSNYHKKITRKFR
ncbi:hypothetical protein HN51_045761 [Arachis hypogaea]|uniref:GATA-type domain-containing protein n=2 Tax=Arachis TaxID=3817 RepID=A0A444XX50_ARAHY|nr:GATA transcription factor 7-like [Arachis hypogaea]RYQ94378.1 hypothetical protein Ahy_B08g089283 [Arachis hypogaea]